MKKTFNINMGGRLFTIDEDAYSMLLDYLDTLNNVFIHQEGGMEVVEDIEIRLADLLEDTRMTSNIPSVSLTDVRQVIDRIGKPEDFIDVTEESCNNNFGESRETETGERIYVDQEPPAYNSRSRVVRKFYRDPDNKMIGGVCSGLAAYFHTDPTWIRIAAVLLCLLSFSTSAIVYLILCIIIPEARTPLEKMQMYGEEPTIENIGKSVTGEQTPPPYESLRKSGKGFLNGVMKFCAAIGWFFIGLMVIIAFPVGLACAVGLVGCIIGLFAFLGQGVFPEWGVINGWNDTLLAWNDEGLAGLLCAIFILISVLIPCIAFIWGLFRTSRHKRVLGTRTAVTLLIMWICSLAVSGIFIGIIS